MVGWRLCLTTWPAAAGGSPPGSRPPPGTPPWSPPARSPFQGAGGGGRPGRCPGGCSCSRRPEPGRPPSPGGWLSAAPAPPRHPGAGCSRRGGPPPTAPAWRSPRAARWPPAGHSAGGPVVAQVAAGELRHLIHHHQQPGPAGRGSRPLQRRSLEHLPESPVRLRSDPLQAVPRRQGAVCQGMGGVRELLQADRLSALEVDEAEPAVLRTMLPAEEVRALETKTPLPPPVIQPTGRWGQESGTAQRAPVFPWRGRSGASGLRGGNPTPWPQPQWREPSSESRHQQHSDPRGAAESPCQLRTRPPGADLGTSTALAAIGGPVSSEPSGRHGS